MTDRTGPTGDSDTGLDGGPTTTPSRGRDDDARSGHAGRETHHRRHVLASAASLGLAACAGCSSSSSAADGPEGVASSYVVARYEGDEEDLRPLVHEDGELIPSAVGSDRDLSVSVESTEVVERTDERATVDVVFTVRERVGTSVRRRLLELRPHEEEGKDDWRVWNSIEWEGEPFEWTVLSFVRALADGEQRAGTLLHSESDLSETLEQRRWLFESVDLTVRSTSVLDHSENAADVAVELSLFSEGVSGTARSTVRVQREGEEWRIRDYEDWPAGPADVARTFVDALSERDVETADGLVHYDAPIEDRVASLAATFSSVDFTVESSELVEKETGTATVAFEFSVRSSDGRRRSNHTVDLRTEFLQWRVWDYQ